MSDVYKFEIQDALDLTNNKLEQIHITEEHRKICGEQVAVLQLAYFEIEKRIFEASGMDPASGQFVIDTKKCELRRVVNFSPALTKAPPQETPPPSKVNGLDESMVAANPPE